MLSPTYEITTALSHTDELISPPYDIAIVTISYGRVIMSSVWDSMMSKKNVGWPFYAAVMPGSTSSNWIWWYDYLRYTTTENYNNGKSLYLRFDNDDVGDNTTHQYGKYDNNMTGWHSRFDDENQMSNKYILSIK